MDTNRQTLEQFFANQEIRINRGAIFDRQVSPKSPSFDFGRVEGMLLGLAIGDSLGVTTEGWLPSQRRAQFGELRDYIPNKYVNEAKGFPSDDTQLAFWTLEQLITDNGFIPENVAARFCKDKIFGIGSTVRQFIFNFKTGVLWYKCGPNSAGNGALMRIAPMLIPHLQKSGVRIWEDTAISAMITHNDTASIAGCVAFVAMLWELLDMQKPPEPEWWVNRYVEIARDLETGSEYTPKGGKFTDYSGPLWQFVQEKAMWAYRKDLSVLDACNAWYSGAFLLETVPGALYILMRHGHEPEEAIVRAVNDTKDNDTVAAIVGAAVGALHGKEAIPKRWANSLSGRTTDSDDGRVFYLIEMARRKFWH
jgi:ADP-ribosyl-[dinitrogen reductase] hydrolase